MMEEVDSSVMYLIYCKNFCKCHNIPSAQKRKREKKERRKKKQINKLVPKEPP
jgi:hypothetical protein